MQVNKITSINFKKETKLQKKKYNTMLYTGLAIVPTCALTAGVAKNIQENKKYKNLLQESYKYPKEKILDLNSKHTSLVLKEADLLRDIKPFHEELKEADELLLNMNLVDSKVRQELKDCLGYPLLRVSEGKPTEMPNCIMLVGDDRALGEKLAKWVADYGKAELFMATDTVTALDYLIEHDKIDLPVSKDWAVIYLKNGDNFINTNIASAQSNANLRSWMSAVAEDHHATFIFQTNDVSQLEPIALQPHRVKKIINIDKVSEERFFRFERAFAEFQPRREKIRELSEEIKKADNERKEYAKKVSDFEEKLKNLKIVKPKEVQKWALLGASIGIVITSLVAIIKERTRKNAKTN